MEYFLDKYFWILGILSALWNTHELKLRASRVIAAKPELALGYRRYAFAELAFYSLPWLVMGVSILVGGLTAPLILERCVAIRCYRVYAIGLAVKLSQHGWVWRRSEFSSRSEVSDVPRRQLTIRDVILALHVTVGYGSLKSRLCAEPALKRISVPLLINSQLLSCASSADAMGHYPRV